MITKLLLSIVKPWKSKYKNIFTLIFLTFYLATGSFAEGTKQLEPQGAIPVPPATLQYGKIYLDNNTTAPNYRVLFAQYNCIPQYRLNIRVNDHSSENIYYGLGITQTWTGGAADNIYYRILDPTGVSVTGAFALLPTTGNGFINTFTQAYAGPNISGSVPTGYDPLMIDPTVNGDYFIEFSSSPTGALVSGTALKFIDITVAQGITPVNGRLWSTAWQLSSGSTNSNTRNTLSQFFVYSDDGIVTLLDLNGMAGGAFTLYCNPWGVSNTGNWIVDRKSTNSWPVGGDLPKYKLFLNDPDIIAFPSGQFGEICDIATQSNCNGTIDFIVHVSKPGSLTFFMDVDPVGPGPEDVSITGDVTGVSDCSLADTITWDGLNGLGVPVTNGVFVSTNIDYLNGLTNLPLWDIEDNPYGIKVSIVRPTPPGSNKLPIFWDDSNFPGGTVNAVDGCIAPEGGIVTGCHGWDNENEDMYNSWWYYLTEGNFSANLTLIRKPETPAIPPAGPNPACEGQTNVVYTIPVIPSATSYIWTLPDGSVVTTATNQISLDFPTTAGGNLSVHGQNADCGDGLESPLLAITVNPNPVPSIAGPAIACQGTSSTFTVTAGLSSYSWTVTGGTIPGPSNANSVTINWTGEGNQTVSVTTSSLTCTNILTTKPVVINPQPANAFSFANNCAAQSVQFTDITTITSGSNVAWIWNFGDPASGVANSSNLQNPSHIFATGGIIPSH